MLGLSLHTNDIRELFKALLSEKKFTSVNREASMTALTGSTTIEIVGASFIADEDAIFGSVNWDYVKREEEWYNSKSLNVNAIQGGVPAAWKAVASVDGTINSNYGWCIYSPDNVTAWPVSNPEKYPSQYELAKAELKKNPESRRAIMIYTRPSMWKDYNWDGRSDFMCTNTVQYLIREGKLHAVVQMRSNDAVWGYKNDRAWQHHVLNKLANELSVEPGNLFWNAGSLHIYARHYHLVDPVNYPK